MRNLLYCVKYTLQLRETEFFTCDFRSCYLRTGFVVYPELSSGSLNQKIFSSDFLTIMDNVIRNFLNLHHQFLHETIYLS
jgi:hypothetical protein